MPATYRNAPTNYVNFARRFSANRDVAQREAAKYAKQAQNAATAAQGELSAAQKKFNQDVDAGTVAGWNQAVPQALDMPKLQMATGGAGRPDAQGQRAQSFPASKPSTGTAATGQSQGALQSQPTRQDALVGTPTRTPESEGPSIAQMLAYAGKKYSGPEGLDTEKATTATQEAQQRLGLLGSEAGLQTLVNETGPSGSEGADKLSAGLLGAAGKRQFDALRARFNPNKELADAQTAAIEKAKKARETSEANAQGWADKAQEAQKLQAEAQKLQAEMDAINKLNDERAAAGRAAAANVAMPPSANEKDQFYGVDKNDKAAMAKRQKEVDAFNAAFVQTDDFGNQVGDFARDAINALSPSQWIAEATGNRNPVGDYFTETFHPDKGNASGSTHGDRIPWSRDDFWVFRSMTPADWAAINKLPHERQKGWIAAKKASMRAAAAKTDNVGSSRSV